ncbi:MT-A70-domain-containing protein [Favolaschia claudopus]|uniref:mRNA m(6)A methyltransferase n=1 Tax=Favolaschia claudopus TaxID=2862362 RepID=A0AAW0EB68_9AGAR
MSTDGLKVVAASALYSLFSSGRACAPMSSMQLLIRVITTKTPPGLLPNTSTPPRFRLTDLSLFESILESFSPTWEHGTLSLSRENGELTVMDVSLVPSSAARTALGESLNPRKRKRVVDEEADSAAGDDDPEDSSFESPLPTTMGSLSKELREVYALMQKGTAKGRLLAEQFRSTEESFEPICPHITKDDCAKARRQEELLAGGDLSAPTSICDLIHFRPLLRAHTDPTLGHCSYLNTCYSEPTYAQSPSIPPFPGATHPPPNTRGPSSLPSGLGAGGRGKDKAPCRYLHYEVDWDASDGTNLIQNSRGKTAGGKRPMPHRLGIGLGPTGRITKQLPPQWINCDLRRFDYSVLGKFHVIMADPPWDIHMSLPYGTMTDDEMRAMPIPALQDEGLLFLWVTGRAMEVGRECLKFWGYTRIDEVVWVKTNQLQRVIRTGRTGHWLNHTKEHMLVGVKTVIDSAGQLVLPSWANRGLDTDVIVSEVRETSRKPDEVYGLIERMCPGGRKIEIFGRKHNTRPGWLTLGNQLGPDQVYEEDLAARIKAKYPDRPINVPAF